MNFAKYITDVFQGYAYGQTPHIDHDDETVSEDIQDFIKRNHFSDVFAELTKKAEIYGHAWAYLYQDEEARTRITTFGPDELFCVYSDTLSRKALFAVRYGRKDRYSDSPGETYDNIVEFLSKPTADATQENLLDRLERLIFQVSMVANISDETFSNAASGVSLGYKLWSTSNLANTFDQKNEKTLQKIFKIWSSLSTNCPDPNMWEDIDVQFFRNTPKNIGDEINNAKNVEGIVSKKTQLGLLSFVDDPQDELDDLQEEDAGRMDIYNDEVTSEDKQS